MNKSDCLERENCIHLPLLKQGSQRIDERNQIVTAFNMRFVEVSPRLYIGDWQAAEHLCGKITHVVTCDPELPQPPGVNFLRIPVLDDGESDMLPYFTELINFVGLASDDCYEFPEEAEEGYRVTVRLKRGSTSIKWGLNWHEGLFKSTKKLVVDDVVENTVMDKWNQTRYDKGWQIVYGDRLLTVNGLDATKKEGRTQLQQQTDVCLVFWRNRAKPSGAVLIHCHAGVSRSSTAILAYWMYQTQRHPRLELTRLRRILSDVEPNEHFWSELEMFFEMGCYTENVEGVVASDAYRQYQLEKARSKWLEEQVTATAQADGQINNIPDRIPEEEEGHQKDGNDHDENTVSGGESSLPSPGPKDTERENEENNVRIPLIEYNCRMCRMLLFTDDDIVNHDGQSYTCTSVFTQPMVWMGDLVGQTGKLTCPCGAKLGAYAWYGLSCSCKAWQTPAFQVHRARIDESRK